MSKNISYTRQNLLFENTMETSSGLTMFNHLEQVNTSGASQNVTISTDFSYSGTHSMKCICNKIDGEAFGGYRAEAVCNQEVANNVERWIGLSIFLPTSYVNDLEPEVLTQYHDFQSGATGHSPPFSLQTSNGRWNMIILSAPTVNQSSGIFANNRDLGTYQTGVWTNWVFHLRFSYGTDGLTEIWKNGRQLYSLLGPNNYNNALGNYLKIGIYKYRWKEIPTFSTVTTRTVYFDNLRIGSQLATYNDVAP